jgi:hypothetical protein
LAAEKDRGFSLSVFAQMTDRFSRLARAEFALDDEAYNRLGLSVAVWWTRASELAREQWLELGDERSNVRDVGLDI